MSWWNTEPHSGQYGGQTVIPPAWPQVDEDTLAQAAASFETFRDHLRSAVIPRLRVQMMKLADAWDGAGSDAALSEASAIIDMHEANASLADATAKKIRNMESSVVRTKIAANGNADSTQSDCEQLMASGYSSTVTEPLVEARVTKGYADNLGVVFSNTAELGSNIGVPFRPVGAEELPTGAGTPGAPPTSGHGEVIPGEFKLPEKSTYVNTSYGTSDDAPLSVGKEFAAVESPGPAGTDHAVAPAPETANPVIQQAPQGAPSGMGSSSSGGGSSGVTSPSGGSGSSMGSSAGSSSGGGGSSSSGSGSGLKADGGSASGTGTSGASGTSTSSAAAGGDKSAAGAARAAGSGVPPAQPVVQPPPAPLSAPPPAAAPPPTPAPTAPAASTGMSAPGFSGGSGGLGGVPVSGAPVAGAPAPPVPLGPPTTPSPPAPVSPGGPTAGAAPAVPPGGPGVAPASTSASSSTAGAAPVPVSAARAERDAVATAATAGALRRQNRGNDPTQLARRIAAALNVNIFDFGFFWVTGLTADGTIVVANSFGIGYIPANVRLPQGVQMATADESIPSAERGRWATYPILALQGWAQHHNQKLRVVIATAEQFEGFDAGAAKIVLQPDDMPEDGTMQGRSRLEILAPGAAATLAATADDKLPQLLPVASADATAPEDNSAVLWFEVCKPLMSTSTARGAAHLAAMRTYSDHMMSLALHKAQSATDAGEQRAAIADWVYWQHESSLIAEALETAPATS